jgi:hypothetical protein
MSKTRKARLVPYAMVPPGFEAVYVGDEEPWPSDPGEDSPTAVVADEAGNVIKEWSVWTWTWPGQADEWNDEIRHINKMQARLGPLDDNARQIRAHIGSLVLCDSGVPVTIDELLNAIGRGKLPEPSFHNGCWPGNLWWEARGTQPRQVESMRTIHTILTGYMAGKPHEDLTEQSPYAAGFINRAYDWLGPVSELTRLQRLMMERMLLPFEFFTKASLSAGMDDTAQFEAVMHNCFGEGGRGAQLDAEIAELAGLPKIRPYYKGDLDFIEDEQKRELYKLCGYIAHGLHTLCDCHHSSFRWIEAWIHGIGTGKADIPTRKVGTERERLACLLFGYTLALDKWLLGKPMQFVLLDLGHVDLGFDPKNEILRVYAYLGEEKTPVKEWLAACLWVNLAGGGNPRGNVIQEGFLERARQFGITTREWMDSVLQKDSI